MSLDMRKPVFEVSDQIKLNLLSDGSKLEYGNFSSSKFSYHTFQRVNIVRINHECEGRIEKSVPRITVWQHQAFYPTLTRIMDSFSCSLLFFFYF